MIIGLIGFINSGKGAVSEILVNEYNFRQDSFASSLKDVCSCIFNWPRDMIEGNTSESREWRDIVDVWWSKKLGIENFTPRLAMQLIGTDSLRNHFNEDLWFLTLENRIRKNPDQHVVISDVRFPNEVRFIKEQNGTLIKVNRGLSPVWYETAILANNGNSLAKDIMIKTYSDIHFSEWAWVGSNTDFQINNDGTLDDLKSQVISIKDKIIL